MMYGKPTLQQRAERKMTSSMGSTSCTINRLLVLGQSNESDDRCWPVPVELERKSPPRLARSQRTVGCRRACSRYVASMARRPSPHTHIFAASIPCLWPCTLSLPYKIFDFAPYVQGLTVDFCILLLFFSWPTA